MDVHATLIALVFAALAAGFVWLGWQGQERYEAARAERAARAAALPNAAEAEANPALAWLQGDLGREDRRALTWLCLAAGSGAWLWLLVTAFRESLAWGCVVLLGNWAGAIVFRVFGSRRSLAPLFIMTGAYGLVLLLNAYGMHAAQ
jgi:Flp pilus assembly protein TadB